MDFMKVFDQTVREIKREVNLKVLKVPEIEQKVLDATDDEPWGPHGSALAEIAQATKKFSECSMVMNVLWTRLSETGRNWRYVYKALAVIEYLVSNGAERAVDDIIEHTFQISSLTSFEYVEPNGKDTGINVRKKAENIVALLNNKDKIQEVRNKAAANRDKYVGLSSSGMTSKSSFSSQSSDSYKGNFKDEDKFVKSTSTRSRRGITEENQGRSSKKSSTRKGADTKSSVSSKAETSLKSHVKSSVLKQSSSTTPSYTEDDFDDFDPRGTSSTKSVAGNSNQVDLFGENFVGDLLDFQPSGPKDASVDNSNTSEADLFADADFVSAPSHVETGGSSESQPIVDLFASKPASSPPATSSVDFFAVPEPVVQPEKNSPKAELQNTNAVDPFAAVPLNNFDGADLFGAFTSTTDSVPPEATKVQDDNHSLTEPKLTPKSNTFQVKSGIWADSLSRGLIDLNISAPKKVSLADVGIVGGLSDEADEREKGQPTSYYMGRAMGMGSGISKSGFTSSSGTAEDDLFSSLGSQQYQFGGFQK